MFLLRNMSIRGKLTVICMATSMFALFVAALTIYVHEVRGLRDQFVTQYGSLARTAAPLTAATLDFLDEQSAAEILTHLAEDTEVKAAAIYDASGHIFSAYARPGKSDANVPAEPLSDGHHYRQGDLYVFEPVMSLGERIGTVYLQVQLSSARERAYAYAALVAAVLIVSIAATFLFSAFLVPFFSRPITELAEKTKRVAEQQNYSVRATRTTNDELGDLIDSFNEMLDQIQKRDEELANHSTRLEAEVASRTQEIRKFALAVEQSPSTVVITDIDGHVEYVNQQFTRTTGYTLELALKCDPEVLKAGRLPEKERARLEHSLRIGKEWRGEFTNQRKNSETFWESASVAPLRASNGRITHYVWIKEDITERKRAEEALRESEDRYALAAQGANDGLWDWDLRNDTVYYSTRWKVMLGCWEEEITPSPDEWFNRVDPRDIETVRHKIDEHLQGKTPHFEHEYRMRHKDGTFRWMLSRGVSVVDEKGNVYRFAGSQTDITDRKKAEEKLFFDASHDQLTGLPNRGLLLERLANAVARAKRNHGFSFALLFLDLDRFKVINDSLGHAAGDELLIEVGRRLGLCVREQDTIARLGGDEFAVLLEGIEHGKDPIRVAERIQQEIGRAYRLIESEVHTSSSIGIALSTHGYDCPEDILRDADAAMYRAKSLGKARFALFDTELHDEAVRRLQLENDLRHAIADHDLTLHYQPIVSLETEQTAGFEALVRWDHPEHGMVPPSEFVPIAEETGMIGPMGWWILEAACQQLRDWQESFTAKRALTVSVNISGKQFLQRDFVERVKKIVEDTGIKGADLKLEITESVVIENPPAVALALRDLHAFGIELCIDDFGTGYSSLSCLHEFPFNVLKIDRSFIDPLDRDVESLDIVQAIIGLSKTLRLTVIAEGVETEGQMAHLANLRCDFAQGYHIARPMPAENIADYLAQRKEITAKQPGVT